MLAFLLNPKNIPWVICGVLIVIVMILSGWILLQKLDMKDMQADLIYYQKLAGAEQAKRAAIEKNRNSILEYANRLERIRKKSEKIKEQIPKAPTVGGKVNDAEPVASDLITIHNDLVDFFTGVQPEGDSKSADPGEMSDGGEGGTSEGGAK